MSASPIQDNPVISYKCGSNYSVGVNLPNQSQPQSTSLSTLPIEEHSLLQERVIQPYLKSKSKLLTVKPHYDDIEYNPSG